MYDYKLTREELIKEKKKFRDNYLKTDADFRKREAINEAIDKARKDLMFRTLTLKPEKASNKEKAADDFKDEIIKELRKEITNYFEEPSKNIGNFDTWHKKTCNLAEDILKKYYDGVEYGKAQKLVNMTFKYLYCCNGAEDNEKYFEYCHMPLDSVILEWYKREANKESHTITAGKIPSWSNLQYMVSKNDNDYDINSNDNDYDTNGKYTYNYFIKNIRELLNKQPEPRLTPLQAEFIIWPYMQLKVATEEFLYQFQIQHDSEKPSNKIRAELREASLDENLKAIREKLNR